MNVGIIGLGKMGSALAEGLIRKGFKVKAVDRHPEKTKNKKISSAENYCDLLEWSGVVLLCVKPKDFPELLSRLSGCSLEKKPLFASIAAGVSIKAMERRLGKKARIARAMPNLNVSVGKAATALAFNKRVSAKDKVALERIFESIGKTVVVKERELNAITALSGSGPAYFLFLAQCMSKAGVTMGLSKKTSELLARETLVGTGKLLDARYGSERTFSEWISSIATPGGTTEAALGVLQKNGFGKTVAKALSAGKARAKKTTAKLAKRLKEREGGNG